jgi:hypothetical protein
VDQPVHADQGATTGEAMIYAELYGKSTGWNGKDFSGPVTDIPLTGSDGIVYLDGRKRRDNQIADVKARIQKHIRKDQITGFIIRAGRSLLEKGRELTPFIKVGKHAHHG